METKVQTQIVEIEKSKLINFIILKTKNNYKIYNLPLYSFVEKALEDYNFITIEIDENKDFRKQLKKFLTNSMFTCVLSDTSPLITKTTISNVVEYAKVKDVKACKLPNGFVFNTKFLKNFKVLNFDNFYMQEPEDFFEIKNLDDLEVCRRVVRTRIFNKFKAIGVAFKDESTTEIEPNVEIKSGTDIYGSCKIKGNTKIGNAVTIHENSIIENSIIVDSADISGSTIINSVIGMNSIVMPYCYLFNTQVGNNVLIKSNNRLENLKIKDNETINISNNY